MAALARVVAPNGAAVGSASVLSVSRPDGPMKDSASWRTMGRDAIDRRPESTMRPATLAGRYL